jgi:hypothetical protein
VVIVVKTMVLTTLALAALAIAACSSSDKPSSAPTVTTEGESSVQTPASTALVIESTPTATIVPASTSTPIPSVPVASALTGPPAVMDGINSMHEVLESEDAAILFGTQADPLTVTLGPVDGGFPDYQAYEGKNSLNFKMPNMTPVLAPLDVTFIGFKNRSATYRQDDPYSNRMEPFDDLELCFESQSSDWPGMVMCVYHLHTTPLLETHLQNADCGIQERWDGEGAEAGRVYYLENSSERTNRNPDSCSPLLDSTVRRGEVLGYSGEVDGNEHSGFRFKVQSADKNPLTEEGDPYLHWVQPKPFFYWQCFEPGTVFQPGVLAYPFDCEQVEGT